MVARQSKYLLEPRYKALFDRETDGDFEVEPSVRIS
jgi:hypothetical protein